MGVTFSLDVVSGKRDRIVIEAIWGLGEPLVQGGVTPDRVVVDKVELREMTYHIADKPTALRRDTEGSGTTIVKLPPESSSGACLDCAQTLEIAKILRELECSMGTQI